MDKIYINELEFIGYHGVLNEEQVLGQKFIISVMMYIDEKFTKKAGRDDDLNYSIHYGMVAEDIKKIFYEKRYKLLESLGNKIAVELLHKYPLMEKIRVSIKKPWAPIGMIFNDVEVKVVRKRHKVYLSLGSNIGDRSNNLNTAIRYIENLPDTFITKKSSILNTEPFGFTDQDDFLNMCLEIETQFTPHELLDELLAIEKKMGRIREFKWGPRNIDIDILFYDKEIINTHNLALPHPYIAERDFVLTPLSEIAGDFIHPKLKKSIKTLKNELKKKDDVLNFSGKTLKFGDKTLIMGILNATPDSFSDGGDHNGVKEAITHAKLMIEQGADIIDVGGESTRPGHTQITESEEIARVVPIIKELKKLDTIISIDSYKHNVVREALLAGADMVNDIWGLQYDDGEMAELVSKYQVPVIAMHNQNSSEYKGDIMDEIKKFFNKTFEIARENGISNDMVILDPGIGFGKTASQNIEVLSRLGELKDMGRILLGTSRKRFIGSILGETDPKKRDIGTLATTVSEIGRAHV